MANLTFWYGVQATGLQNGTRELGSLAVPARTLTGLTGLWYEKDFSVSQNTTKTLFTAGTDLADFDFLIITTDQDGTAALPLMLELVTDSDASIGRVSDTVRLTKDLPYMLFADDSYANYTTNFGGGTLDLIEVVRCRNLNATTAKVTVFAMT